MHWYRVANKIFKKPPTRRNTIRIVKSLLIVELREMVLNLRIPMITTNLPFQFRRFQYLVKLCFLKTTYKA